MYGGPDVPGQCPVYEGKWIALRLLTSEYQTDMITWDGVVATIRQGTAPTVILLRLRRAPPSCCCSLHQRLQWDPLWIETCCPEMNEGLDAACREMRQQILV